MKRLRLEDMLGRRERALDQRATRSYIAERRVLITGAAGTIGAAMAEELAALGAKAIILADHNDHGLIEVMDQLAPILPQEAVEEVLCDIRDGAMLSRHMCAHAPQLVIHAAALKHVHMGERHAAECVLTNLVGVRNALRAAEDAGAEQFVFISSDKAVDPVSVMGACKRLAEIYLAKTTTRLTAKSVRFGNVFGSRGSVVERFLAQIDRGGPVEVTDPAMERYFMSAGEAVRLILAVAAGEPDARSAYFLDMGAPVNIMDLARRVIAASGVDAPIIVTGARPGEKLGERLTDDDEAVSPSRTPGVMQVEPLSARAAVTDADIDALEAVARRGDAAEARRAVFALLHDRVLTKARLSA